MAFLICFKKPGTTVDYTDKALYLQQDFYELIFSQCIERHVLGRIAKLGYGDAIELGCVELEKLKDELAQLTQKGQNEAAVEFIQTIDESLSAGNSLVISGDMYPVLK